MKTAEHIEARFAQPKRLQAEPLPDDFSVRDVLETSRKVKGLLRGIEIEPTAEPAIHLHLFNVLRRDPPPTKDELSLEVARAQKLSNQEREYQNPNNPLPTIGIEIETPEALLKDLKVYILDELNIPNYLEQANLHLHEVNPAFSYSPWPQARIIQELAVLGALPLFPDKDKTTLGKIPYIETLSLHVNFGLPQGLSKSYMSSHHDTEGHLLNDALVYAFASPERLWRRKTNVSLAWKGDAADSAKTNTFKRRSTLARMELRANEFKDFPTYRMLVESQRLAAIFFSYAKIKRDLPVSPTEKELARLWKGLERHIKDLLAAYELNVNAIDKKERAVAIETVRETDIKTQFRSLSTHFSHEVATVLQKYNLDLPTSEAA